MRIYLAGPMTSIEFFNFPAFDIAAFTLRRQGHEVFSPADNDRGLLGKPPGWLPSPEDSTGPWQRWAIPGAPDLRTMLGMDLAWIAANADAIAMMPGWEKSSGAFVEWAMARALGLSIYYLPPGT